MPTYQYYCDNCKLPVEISKPMAKASDTEWCAICGSEMERKYTPVAHSFGWRLSEKFFKTKGMSEIEGLERAV